ncbi:MAG: hypothetical protein PWP07_2578 [Epulopiscium sp.]|nr:hypothetical protein [Candidatus Epulonipiscium sp.]
MRKTLQYAAGYLKDILVSETYEAYEINPIYANDLSEENIRKGVLAVRAFLVRIYDALYAKGEIYDHGKKDAHEYANRTSLLVHYPFLNTVKIILMNIGYSGILAEDAQSIICENTIFNEKVSGAKNLECLRFLADCGLCVEGMDINNKKQKLTDIQTIKISYPDDPMMLTGLKVMATAEREHGTLVNQDIFLRCDYRVLKKETTDVFFVMQDMIRPLSSEIQDFIQELHYRYLNKGLNCIVEIKGFHIYIMYCYKRKVVWGLNASLNTGYHINVKPTKTEEYTDSIKTFSPILQDLIAKGYGCGRKREIGRCDGSRHHNDRYLFICHSHILWQSNPVKLEKKF